MPPKRKYEKNAPTVASLTEKASQTQDHNTTTSDTCQEDKGKISRTRNFAFLVYPDSAPADWRDRLNEFHVEILISPLHDKDVNPSGEPKKAHYHVLVMYSGVKTVEQARELRDAVGGVGWENVASIRGYARYLCHLDNPEKAQYSTDGVIELGGADYAETIRRAADATKMLREITIYIEENNVLWYDEFVRYCAVENPEWFDLLMTGGTYTVYTYIKSRGKRIEAENRALAGLKVNPKTGEVS